MYKRAYKLAKILIFGTIILFIVIGLGLFNVLDDLVSDSLDDKYFVANEDTEEIESNNNIDSSETIAYPLN